jgi:hypothetical protein
MDTPIGMLYLRSAASSRLGSRQMGVWLARMCCMLESNCISTLVLSSCVSCSCVLLRICIVVLLRILLWRICIVVLYYDRAYLYYRALAYLYLYEHMIIVLFLAHIYNSALLSCGFS